MSFISDVAGKLRTKSFLTIPYSDIPNSYIQQPHNLAAKLTTRKHLGVIRAQVNINQQTITLIKC